MRGFFFYISFIFKSLHYIVFYLFLEVYKYKYDGKELEDEMGLNIYGMDWRQYEIYQQNRWGLLI